MPTHILTVSTEQDENADSLAIPDYPEMEQDGSKEGFLDNLG